MRKVHLEMRSQTSTAIESAGRRAPPRLVLAVLFSLAAFFAAALRPVSLFAVSTGRAITTPDDDTPVAIDEEGRAQCRVTAVRPAREGRGHVRDVASCPVAPSWCDVSARVAFDAPAADAARDLAPMRRIRKHVEVMVFLI